MWGKEANMVPWDMLPKDLQKGILAMIILYGGTRVCAGPGPMVCDPPPPPTFTPQPGLMKKGSDALSQLVLFLFRST